MSFPVERRELVVVGAGPAGMTAAAEASRYGMDVLMIEESGSCGGQLNKQIHKFFGSKEHGAGKRGFEISRELEEACRCGGVEIRCGSPVVGAFSDGHLLVRGTDGPYLLEPRMLISATGAAEKALAFHGWTLPGVMGAGAAQTLMNLNGVRPGKRVAMVGSGNVGLIVAYQMIQAGVEVSAVVEIGPSVGGYEVHLNRLKTLGVPILLRHKVIRAEGSGRVEALVVRDEEKGVAKGLEVDCVCLAVGMKPVIEIPQMLGCGMAFQPELGGWLPRHGRMMDTTKKGVWVAGDGAGVEEASVAMEEGRLAAVATAMESGKLRGKKAAAVVAGIELRLSGLRAGTYNCRRRQAKMKLLETAT
jgi:thioredoxin reductase